MTLWPSGLRRQLQVLDTLSALFRKGVGSSPTGVIVLHFQPFHFGEVQVYLSHAGPNC